MKKLFIAEKPSVAQQFADALKVKGSRKDGYIEDENYIVTWCVGHLVTMSYPDAYNPELKKWSPDTIPFIPEDYKYEIIPAVAKQFNIVKGLLTRDDVETIYVCTDSGREGEYIYRLVDQMAEVDPKKDRRRVWIDSQTEEEILRGINEAKPLSEYDNLSSAAYLRAKEDYLMGINFSRALTLKYSYPIKQYLGVDKCVIAVGRVMTCVLGMVVKREREIREFVSTPFYRVIAGIEKPAEEGEERRKLFEAEWKAVKGSKYFESPKLYKENGFKERKDAEELIEYLKTPEPVEMTIKSISKKTEKKNPPMLYNLAELQNDCSKRFKISPTDTLNIVQELYEKKLVTYPRTDARVLSTAIAKEIDKNIKGLISYGPLAGFAQNIIANQGYAGIAKSKYVNDKLITDHYAIIPTGQGLGQLSKLPDIQQKVYDLIARRFLSIFYAPAEYQKLAITLVRNGEEFSASFKMLVKPGYLKIANPAVLAPSGENKSAGKEGEKASEDDTADKKDSDKSEDQAITADLMEYISSLKKGSVLPVSGFEIKEGKTNPPQRYNSGSMILAMENAGKLIEDEELREQIKGSGIGTSATRDAIITKLVNNKYISLNKKTQILTPTFLGEIIYDVVLYSINGLLSAELTASWEYGLQGVADGEIPENDYIEKMNGYVVKYVNIVKGIRNQNQMHFVFDKAKPYYTKK
ncbi:DNA topoisomerase-3 [Lachnospiraceae bacterium NE2001]|nr:DNA topoisomerase-3 [Lachnospiraceae bacterium NE2001]